MAEATEVMELRNEIDSNARDIQALRERVDYLTVAVMRGDPRFASEEHADPDFDCAAFDADWVRKGRRVPSMSEVFG